MSDTLGPVLLQAGVGQLDESARDRLRDTYGALSTVGYVILLSVCGLATLVSWLLVAQLLFFHLGLIYRGVTTYEFIVAQARARPRKQAPARQHARAALTRGAVRPTALCAAAPEAKGARRPANVGLAALGDRALLARGAKERTVLGDVRALLGPEFSASIEAGRGSQAPWEGARLAV